MRIAFLGDSRSIHIRRWVRGVADRGHDVDLITFRSERVEGVRQHVLHFEARSGLLRLPANVRTLRTLLRRLSPDLVHGQPVAGYGFWAAVAGYHPLVLSSWGSDLLIGFDRWETRRTVRYALRRADALICVADHLRARAVALGADPARCRVIPMGVDLAALPAQAAQPRETIIVSTRALWPIYDVGTLVRAMARVRGKTPSARAEVFGEGKDREALERLAADLGVHDGVTFRGHRDPVEVFAALGRASLYVSTAKSDGASVSLMEAMAMGTIPIATDIPANRDWIDPGTNGLLFPAGDDRALAEAILRSIRDDELRHRAAEANRAVISRRGDAAANLRTALEVYETVVRAGAIR